MRYNKDLNPPAPAQYADGDGDGKGKIMRYALYLVLVCALVLSACGGGGDGDNDTVADNTQQTDQTAPAVDPNATPTEDTGNSIADILTVEPVQPHGVTGNEPDELEVPLPGTLVASATEDPDAGLIFDRVVFTMTGGADNTTLTIELKSDGTMTRDGVVGFVGQDVVNAVDTLLDEVNFFGLQATFLGPAPDSTVYRYSLRVERAGAERTINAQDGYTPDQIKSLFAKLAQLGAPTQGS
jgi:hypothetical protein